MSETEAVETEQQPKRGRPSKADEMGSIIETMTRLFTEGLRTVVAEIRKPPELTPVQKAAQERIAKQKAVNEKGYWDKITFRKGRMVNGRFQGPCSHLRENGSCCICWAVQSDGIERGHCPHCDSFFEPSDGELYEYLRRLFRGQIENVRYVS